jgi:serine/threonine-protein kinase
MPDASATAQEAPSASLPKAGNESSLDGIACCSNLPEKEGLGPPLEEELPDGHVLEGRFVLHEAIGRSGAATIYRAQDQAAGGRTVAVKVPLARVEADPVAFGRFEREERIGSKLDDPGMLKFIPVAAPKSRPFIVTEFIDGCTLALVIHRAAPLPEADALKIASVICGILARLHARGIMHRDLKPSNIMVRRDRRLCLMDFGLSAEISDGPGFLAALTPLFGTPEYMAPEQVRNKRNDARTDLYSLGVILYQMLTGVLPFKAQDPWKAAHMKVAGDPPAPRSVNPAISPQAEEIVLHAMQRRPGDRYPTALSLKAELDAPGKVHVTGMSLRLRAHHWRLSLQGTPFLAGGLIGFGALAFLVGLFLVLSRHR